MSDSWIDKKELNDLVSGLAPGRGLVSRQSSDDIFDDIPSIHMPRGYNQAANYPAKQQSQNFHQHPVYAPSESQFQVVQQPPVQHNPSSNSPLQVLVKSPRVEDLSPTSVSEGTEKPVASPFAFDDDDDDDLYEIETQIENLASETARALRVLGEIRQRVDASGLTGNVAIKDDSKVQIVEARVAGKISPRDRIPLDVVVDSHLSLKGRLRSLSEILKTYVGLEEMLVVDRDGFTLYATDSSEVVRRNVGAFLKSIRTVYDSEVEARQHTCSQLVVEKGKWLCIIQTDGEINGKFLMKALLPEPLDRPEIYVLVELLNEVLRPESA